jgi:hypothetical protein
MTCANGDFLFDFVSVFFQHGSWLDYLNSKSINWRQHGRTECENLWLQIKKKNRRKKETLYNTYCELTHHSMRLQNAIQNHRLLNLFNARLSQLFFFAIKVERTIEL